MREGIVFAAIIAASAAMLSCGSDDEPQLFVTIHTRKFVPDGFEVQEMGCMSLSFGRQSGENSGATAVSSGSAPVFSDGGIPISDGFGVSRTERSDGLRVFAFAGAQALAIKIYSEAFFESGKTDRFEVETPIGTRYQLAHRGAFSCEQAVDLFAE
jgi:hypothetical protein